MGTRPEPALTPEQVRELDAQYRPFPDFRSFAAATVDTEIWQSVADSLENKQANSPKNDFDRAVEVAARAAAVDTGAIEGLYTVDRGFTITVATQEEGWEAEFEKKGADARRLFEAQLNGYELARNLAKSEIPLNEAWIRRLHAETVEPQDTYEVLTPQGKQAQALPKGEYKTQSNSVRLPGGSAHAYAPVDRVPVEMQRLLAEMRTVPFEQAHPVLQAAYAHYAFVTIHPFADGNGRVARALASVFLLQAYGLPLVMYEDQRPDYYDALAAADQGNHQPFVDFIFDRTLVAMRSVADQMGPSLEQKAEALRGTLTARGGLSHQELENIGIGILQNLDGTLRSAIDSLRLPRGVRFATGKSWGKAPPDSKRYRQIPYSNPKALLISLRSGAPAEVEVSIDLRALIAKDKQERYVLLLQRIDPPNEFPIRLADIYPKETTDFKRRLAAWLRSILAEGLERLTEQAERSLREAGY